MELSHCSLEDFAPFFIVVAGREVSLLFPIKKGALHIVGVYTYTYVGRANWGASPIVGDPDTVKNRVSGSGWAIF